VTYIAEVLKQEDVEATEQTIKALLQSGQCNPEERKTLYELQELLDSFPRMTKEEIWKQ